jgi:hypothetical protein
LKGQLTHFANLTRRFATVTKRSSPDDYLNLAHMLPEVLNLERPFDNWIELTKRDEFQERECAVELSRSAWLPSILMTPSLMCLLQAGRACRALVANVIQSGSARPRREAAGLRPRVRR